MSLNKQDPAAYQSASLDLLATMSAEFANSLDVDATLMGAVTRITDFLDAEGGAVFILHEKQETLVCEACYGATEITGLRLAPGQGIVGRCVSDNEGALVRDVRNDPNFWDGADQKTGFTTLSILCAPLSVNDTCIGAIELVNKKQDGDLFDEQDLKVLETLSASAALAILNARMAKALVEQERTRRELELASEIQRSLLPEGSLGEGLLSGVNIPARGVSGDFFDYFELADGRFYFALGDVSGKGMNAALLMTKTASLFRSLGKEIQDPGKLLGRLNAEVCETVTHGMFVTMLAGIYDPRPGKQGSIRISNAGHEPPLLQSLEGTYTAFQADGPPLGILPPVAGTPGDYPEQTILPDSGTFYVFTDGVTEGFTQDGSILEVHGLQKILNDTRHLPAHERLQNIVSLITPDGRSLRDDITLLALDDNLRARASGANTPQAPEDNPRHDEGSVQLARIAFPADAAWLKVIRAMVTQCTEGAGCVGAETTDIVMAIDEACQNVIRHAYKDRTPGTAELEIKQSGHKLVFRLRDFAPRVGTHLIKPRKLDDVRPGGLGTHLIREIMDETDFLVPADGTGNLLRMVKYIKTPSKKDDQNGNQQI